MPCFEYSAFISYAHKDKLWAKWLKRKLENSRLPVSPTHKDYSRIYDGAAPCLEELPCRHPRHALRDVFLDERNAGNGELSEVLRRSIAKSKFLIVICSPAAKQSRWVALEIACFKELNPDTFRQRIIPLIVEGRVDEQRGINECFPEELDPTTLGSVVRGLHTLQVGSGRRAVRLLDSATRLSIALAGKDLALSRITASLLGIDNPDSIFKSRRRAVRRRRRFLFLLLLTVLAGYLGYYFRFVHTYTRYYANYVERNGIPEGMHRLRPSELPLQYQYYEFKIRDRRVRELRCRNSWGEPAEAMQPGIWNRYPQLVYEYTPEGLVSKIRCRKDDGLEGVVTFPGTSRDRIQLLAPSGESVYLLNNKGETSSRLHYLRTRRNARGEIVRMTFHANTNPESLGETSEGVSGIGFERDSAGLVRRASGINMAGNPGSFGKGIFSERYDYDDCCRCIGHAVFGEDGSPAYDDSYTHAFRFSGLGTDSITIANLGADGNPCPNKECIAFVSQVTRGNTRTHYFFDHLQQPVLSKSLMAASRQERDPKTGDKKEIFLDTEGRPTLCKEKYTVKTITTRGDTTYIAYYDTQMRSCIGYENETGVAIQKKIRFNDSCVQYEAFSAPGERCIGPWESPVKIEYINEWNRLDSCVFLEKPGIPLQSGLPVFIKYVYDSFGNRNEERRYAANGRLMNKLLQEYDERGNRTSQRAVNEQGEPVTMTGYEEKYGILNIVPEDIREIRWQYDNFGRKSATTFDLWPGNTSQRYRYDYDRFGNVVQIRSEGDCEHVCIRIKYDSIGKNQIEMTCFDENLRPKEIDGVFRCEQRYDRRDNLLGIKMYDQNNNLTSSNAIPSEMSPWERQPIGAGFVKNLFDERDNCIELQIFDRKGLPLATPEFGSIVKYSYDEMDRITEIAHYHNGKPYTTVDFHKQRFEHKNLDHHTVKYLNGEDELMNTSFGYAEVRFENMQASTYDKDGRCLEYSYFRNPERQEDPIEFSGFHHCKITYNKDHTHKEEFFYNKYGRRCTNREIGISRISTVYDASGKEIQVIYRDSLDRIADCSEGYAEVRRTYDKRGREIKMAFFHADGSPAEVKTTNSPYKGISYCTRTHFRIHGKDLQDFRAYNKDRLLLKIFTQDSTGRLINCCDDFYAKIMLNYDKKRHLESVEFYDYQNVLKQIRKFEYRNDRILLTFWPTGNLILRKADSCVFKGTEPGNEEWLRITKLRQDSYLLEVFGSDENLLRKMEVNTEFIFVYFGLKEETFD